jgi:hypothetical protein
VNVSAQSLCLPHYALKVGQVEIRGAIVFVA